MRTKRLVRLAMTIGTASAGAIGATAAAATLHVPGDFAAIQACIDAAVSGVDECVVAPGTYHETIDLLGKAITVRSSGGADVTTIDATGLNSSVVTCANGEGSETVLDGFTITGGTGTIGEHGFTYGGGMYNNTSSPTITNCSFVRNIAGIGGGVYYVNSRPTVHHCTFSDNTATDSGGGMSNDSSSPTVINCTFSGNTAYAGGGMHNENSSPWVMNCAFKGNMAVTFSGVGGGMYNLGGNPTVSNCVFNGNTANDIGGGMFNFFGGPTVTNCTFSGNMANDGGGMYNNRSTPMVTNCSFNGNTANSVGGGMYNGGGAPIIADCTFIANTGAYGGGMYNEESAPTIVNCILWNDAPDEIMHHDSGLSVPTIRFSDVQGGLPDGAVDGGGNIDSDPLFVRLPNPGPDGTWDGVDDDYGDLRLQAGSPGIDAGDPAFVAQPGETDLEGHARVLCGRVDMGAYEFGIGDHDCDQSVNLTDFAGWASCMNGPQSGPYEAGCESFDFDGDGSVSLLDFSGFQRVFAP